MKIEKFIIIVPAATSGGISTFTASYARELYRRGCNVLIVLWVDLSSQWSVKVSGFFDELPTLWVEFDSLDKASEVARCLSSQLRLKDGDCIISQSMPWIGHIVSHERTTKDVFHVEILHNDTAQHYDLAGRLAPTCDLFLTVSTPIARKLIRRLNKTGDGHVPVAVSFAGIEVPPTPILTPYHDPFRFCFVGRLLQEQKRIYDLVTLTKYLIDAGIDFEFSIIGGGSDKVTLKQRFEEIDAHRQVHFLGSLPHLEVLSHLSKHHALVLTSDYEGGPIVVCEAMAHGVVPVATRVGICEDVIRDGENGFLVEIGDVRTMADRLLEIAANPGICSKMSHKAWETARKKLAIPVRVDTFLKAVEEACSAKASHRHAKHRSLRIRSVLDHPLIPNTLTRFIRKQRWALMRRHTDTSGKIKKSD